jgi:hypothetical protein
MLMPSISLPTGPYDFHASVTPCSVYEERLARLRDLMRARQLTHVIIYGNVFDHAALGWFANFTPKLGPALMLVALETEPRLLFSGGPGMKPSAERLTWVTQVAALKGLGKEVSAWLEPQAQRKVGIIAGASALLGDWAEIEKAAGAMVALDGDLQALRAGDATDITAVRASARLLQLTADHMVSHARTGGDLLDLVLKTERFAYALEAQDLRLRVARKPWGRPCSLPDAPAAIAGALPVALAIRVNGYWAYGDFVMGDIAAVAPQVKAQLAKAPATSAYVNRVAFPDELPAQGGLVQVAIEHHGARWSSLCVEGEGPRENLFWPPGL